MPCLGRRKYRGSTGTGLAQPKPTVTIISRPNQSMCRRGFRLSRRARLAVGSPKASAASPWHVSCTVRHRNTDTSRSSRSHREPKSSAFHKFSRYPTGLPPQNSIQVHYIKNSLRLQAKKNSRPHGAAVPAIAYRFSCFRASMGFSRRMRRVAYSMVANTTTNTLPTAMATLYHGI